MKRYLLRRAVAVVAVAVMAVGCVGGIAYALTSSPTTSPGPAVSAGATTSSVPGTSSATGTRKAALGRLVKLLRRAVRVQIVVPGPGGSFRTVDIDKGTVTSISTTSITVAPVDGSSPVTASITSSTHEPKTTTISQGEDVYMLSSGGNALIVRPVKAVGSST